MNLSPRKKNILHPAHNIFDDVDMSKSNLRNNKNVINPILVGADINNKELVKSYEQNGKFSLFSYFLDQDKEKDKQESQEFDENHQFERVFDRNFSFYLNFIDTKSLKLKHINGLRFYNLFNT